MSGSTILIAEDDAAIRTVLHHALTRAGYEVRATDTAAALWQCIERGDGNLVICDVVLPDESGFELLPRIKRHRPDLPVIMMSARNSLLTAITAAERGAFEYLPKPFDLKELASVVQRALAGIARTSTTAAEEYQEEYLPLIGRSPAMQEIYRVVARLTQTDLTVLITGESGTGKELVAHALHDYGKRRGKPFVAANMAAIPKDLIESDLFGHERGAFTGATARAAGRFEQAAGGTLFLDEIGDMPVEAQTRLLRVLQQGEYTSVGGRRVMKTDVRIVAATNHDPRVLLQQGGLREDLFYRLNVVPLRLPPLRGRVQDIPDLARHFLRQAAEEGGVPKRFDVEAMEALRTYRWPGNVRELQNLIRRLAALHAGEVIPRSAVAAALRETGWSEVVDSDLDLGQMTAAWLDRYFAQHEGLPPLGLHQRVLEEVERPLLSACLTATGGNQLKAAQLLGLNRNTLHKKLREFGLDSRSDRAQGPSR